MSIQIGRFDYSRGEYVTDWKNIEATMGGPGPAVELRRGPFQATRDRKLAQTWWGQAWIERCEAKTDRKTINKGRRIGRNGSILAVRLAPGNLCGVVCENPYYAYYADLIGINTPILSHERWQIVNNIMTSNSRYIAGLLAGHLSQELYERLAEHDIDLIPDPSFYSHDTHRYYSYVMSHGLALAYVISAFLDNDPLMMFRLLGGNPDLLLARWIGDESPSNKPVADEEDNLASFWISQQLPPSHDALNLTQPPNINGLPPEHLGKIPEIREWVAEEAALELADMHPLIDDAERPVFPPTSRKLDVTLNGEQQKRYDELIALTDAYCEDLLDEEFTMLARRMTRALVAQSKSLVTSGHAGTWAAAIIYALSEVNQIFEDNIMGYHHDPDILCAAFKRSLNTTGTRARRIRKRLGIGTLDPDWTHSTHRATDPRTNLVRVRGFLISPLDN